MKIFGNIRYLGGNKVLLSADYCNPANGCSNTVTTEVDVAVYDTMTANETWDAWAQILCLRVLEDTSGTCGMVTVTDVIWV